MSLEMRYSLDAFELDRTTGETSRSDTSVALVFESVLEVNPTSKSVLTKYAVELDAPRADHKRDEGQALTIRVAVTDHVLGPVPETGSRTRANAWRLQDVSLPGVKTVSLWRHEQTPTRVRDVLDELRTLRVSATDIVVVHGDDAWSRMQVVDVSAPRSAKAGDAREIVIMLEQVRTAVVSTVDAPQPRQPRARRRTPAGEQGATDVPAAQQAAVRQSASAAGIDAISNFFSGGS